MILRAVGDRRGEAIILHNLASVEEALGQLGAAELHYRQSLANYTALGLQQDMQREDDALARAARMRSGAGVGAGAKKRRHWWPFGR